MVSYLECIKNSHNLTIRRQMTQFKMVQAFDRCFYKKCMQMAKKHMKIRKKILVIRKRIKIENKMNYQFTSTSMAIVF